MATWNKVNIGTKPLPEPMLANKWWDPLGFNLLALSLDDVKIPVKKPRLKIAILKWHLGLPGANELTLPNPSTLGEDKGGTIAAINFHCCDLKQILTSFAVSAYKSILASAPVAGHLIVAYPFVLAWCASALINICNTKIMKSNMKRHQQKVQAADYQPRDQPLTQLVEYDVLCDMTHVIPEEVSMVVAHGLIHI